MMNRSFTESECIPGAASGLAVLSMDGLKLLLPQSAIQTLEPALDLEVDDKNPRVAGFLTFEGKRWPVHCLSKDFVATKRIPETRRFCVFLKAKQGFFCLLCDNVLLLKNEHAKMTPIPICMNAANSPFQYLAMLEKGIACVSSVERLVDYVQPQSPDEPAVQSQTDYPDVQLERGIG